MKKTLVVVSHPDMNHSTVHRHWVKTLEQYHEHLTIHELYKTYPSEKIDVKHEQRLIEQHENLILQFPVYWFNCPPLLKKWLDEVLTYGWAYGKDGHQMAKKKVGLAVSAGIQESDYEAQGRYKSSLQNILSPFELTMQYVNADYQPLFAFYGATNEPEAGYGITPAQVAQSAQDYVRWIQSWESGH